MNVRKIFLFLACILSGLGVFLPFYVVDIKGEVAERITGNIFSNIYGIVLLVALIVTVIGALADSKKTYVISSLVALVATGYSVIAGTMAESGSMMVSSIANKYYNAADVESVCTVTEGPAFFLLIFGGILLLVTMLWNALGNE